VVGATQQAPTAIPTSQFLSVEVKGKLDVPMGLPAKLPPLTNDQRPIADGEIVTSRMLQFGAQSGNAGGVNSKFVIAVNDRRTPPYDPKKATQIVPTMGTQFNPTVVNECVEVDTAEEWTLLNYTTVGHPCHIHLNPFFVTDFYDPNDPPNPDNPHGRIMKYNDPVGLWQDTIIVPAAQVDQQGNIIAPGWVTFKHRFPKITGTFVMHCHILGHEDRGFMHVVQVHAKGQACSPLCPHT
jgi:FtsP/CotA-like multicopper oxidase with cupredoxin domain